jgi:hypothetical protein
MSTLAVPTATYLGELGPSGEAELAVRVASAGAKGMGAFAAEAAQPGRWIGSYQGPLISLDEQRDLYSETDPEYLFQITPDLYIDGNLSTHFTRFFNHDQKGNLNFTVSVRSGTLESVPSWADCTGSWLRYALGTSRWAAQGQREAHGPNGRLRRGRERPRCRSPITDPAAVDAQVEEQRVDFFAATAIAPGTELCFDYGVGYWLGSAASPADGSDTRNFSLAAAAPPLPGPPPLTPRTAGELQRALQLPPPEARAALLRCLGFFGSVRVSETEVDIPLRLPPEAEDAERETVAEEGTPSQARVDPASCPLATLEAAASSCVAELVRRQARREGGEGGT